MNRENLRTLADYLAARNLKKRFDMTDFCKDKYYMSLNAENHKCGTVACAIGMGPDAGLEPIENESWYAYSDRVFGIFSYHDSNAWTWCFSDEWSYVDNTAEGAAARIYWLLDHGLPKDWQKQMIGKAPLCYRQRNDETGSTS